MLTGCPSVNGLRFECRIERTSIRDMRAFVTEVSENSTRVCLCRLCSLGAFLIAEPSHPDELL